MIHLKQSKSSEHDKSLSSMINHTACCYIPLSSLQYYIIHVGCTVTGTFPSYMCVQHLTHTSRPSPGVWPLGNAASAQLLVGVKERNLFMQINKFSHDFHGLVSIPVVRDSLSSAKGKGKKSGQTPHKVCSRTWKLQNLDLLSVSWRLC